MKIRARLAPASHQNLSSRNPGKQPMRQCGTCLGYGTVPGRIHKRGAVEEITCSSCDGYGYVRA